MIVRPATRGELRCSICHDGLGRSRLTCPSCGTWFHRDCRDEVRRCPTLGCASTEWRRSPPPPPRFAHERPPRRPIPGAATWEFSLLRFVRGALLGFGLFWGSILVLYVALRVH